MAEGIYIGLVHPRTKAQLASIDARERWKMQYREQRMRAKGYPEHQIKPVCVGELGQWEGMRFTLDKRRAH